MITYTPRASIAGEIIPPRVTGTLPGAYPVGVCHLHAVDESRWDHQDSCARQFMVCSFYPAKWKAGTFCARFIDLFQPEIEGALRYLTRGLHATAKGELVKRLHSLRMQSFKEAEPQISGPYPVVIYYPGGGSNRLGCADVCEGLASRGYVVFAVDGPHDAELVVFPDGRLCKGPLKGDYIGPGVGDVGYLLSQLQELNGYGLLAGMVDRQRVGLFGHSRGGYISNVSAFQHDGVCAAASIDSFLWGYMSEGTGLEKHSLAFQEKVRATPMPILRLCGRPAGTNPQHEAGFCLERDGGDFVGDVSVVAFPGWSHGDFATTPWLCGKGESLFAHQSRPRTGAGDALTNILAAFFDTNLKAANPDELALAVQRYPTLAVASRWRRDPVSGCNPGD